MKYLNLQQLGEDYSVRLSKFTRILGNHQQGVSSLLYGFILAFLLAGLSFAGEPRGTEPLAEISGEIITAEELNKSLGTKLAQLEEQIYNLKRQELDSLIAQRLLAKEAAKRGISVAALLDAEVTAKVGLVTETEIENFYQANKARMPGDDADVRQKIRAFLQKQLLDARRNQFVGALRSQGNVVVWLQPPPEIRVEVSTDGAPVRGAADAPVTSSNSPTLSARSASKPIRH